jgi:hypothetical protein
MEYVLEVNMKKILSTFAILAILISSILPITVFASDTLFEYYNTGNDVNPPAYGNITLGQTFTPQTTHVLTSVKLKLYKTGEPSVITCYLLGTAAGLPDYPALASATYNSYSLTSNANGEWIEFTFAAPATVNSGTKYAIVLDVPFGNASNTIRWLSDGSSPSYTGGNLIGSNDDGANWSAYTTDDLMFEEYGTYPVTTPLIVLNAASNITQYEARLNSTVSDDGYEVCDVRFGYGTTTQAAVDFEDYDTVTSWVDDTYSTGNSAYVDIDSLVTDTTYYFRVQIKNSAGTTTSDELTFATESSFSAPTEFRAVTEATVINLFWTKGNGASTTMIRYSYGGYPATTADGILLYNGTGSNTTHTGLSTGSTVYYTAWSISGVDESDDVNLLATTLIEDEGDVNITDPTEPVNWFLDIDPTTMANFEPVYSTVNNTADAIGMPHSTFWFLMATTLSVLAGFGVYTWKKTLLGAGLVALICMIIASTVSLIPGFMIFLVGIVIISIGTVARRFGT